MEEMRKKAQTPEETARELSELAEKLEEMDRAEGAFGEAMADALTDEYLEEVAGGLPQPALTTPGRAQHWRSCRRCGTWFGTYDEYQDLCNPCLGAKDRGPM